MCLMECLQIQKFLMLMVISLWKFFILNIGTTWPRNFAREKSPSIIGRVKIKAKNTRHNIYINYGNNLWPAAFIRMLFHARKIKFTLWRLIFSEVSKYCIDPGISTVVAFCQKKKSFLFKISDKEWENHNEAAVT